MNNTLSQLKRLLLDAVFIATAVVFMMIIHSIGGRVAGSLWVPMWWGAFLAGILLGPIDGLVVGFLTPFVSFITRGMPPYPFWLIFAVEVGIYGFMWGVSSVLLKKMLKEGYLSYMLSTFIGLIMGKLGAALVLMFIIPGLAPKMASHFYSAFMAVLVYWTLKSLPGILVILVVGPLVIMSIDKILKQYN